MATWQHKRLVPKETTALSKLSYRQETLCTGNGTALNETNLDSYYLQKQQLIGVTERYEAYTWAWWEFYGVGKYTIQMLGVTSLMVRTRF